MIDPPAVFSAEPAVELDLPQDLQYAPDGASFFVSGYDSQNIQEYDASTGALLNDFAVPGNASGFAINAAGTFAYVTLYEQSAVAKVDLSSGEVTTIPTPNVARPHTATIMPLGDVLVVTNGATGNTAIINLTTDSVVETTTWFHSFTNVGISFGIGTPAYRFNDVVPIDNDYVVSANESIRADPGPFNSRIPEIQFLNVRTGVVERILTDPLNGDATIDKPFDAAVSGDGSTLVVANRNGNVGTVWVVDIATRTISSRYTDFGNTFSTGNVFVNQDGSRALVADGGQLVVVDLATGVFGPRLSTNNVGSGGFAVSDLFGTGDTVFGGNEFIPIVNLPSPPAAVTVSYNPTALDFAEIGNASPVAPEAAITNMLGLKAEQFVIVESGSVKGTGDVQRLGDNPEADVARWVAVSPNGDFAATSNQLTDNVGIFDLTDNSLVGYFDVGQFPQFPTFTPDGNKVIVPNNNSNFVSIIDIPNTTVQDVSIASGGSPAGVGGSYVQVSPDGNFAYVLSTDSPETLYRLNLNTNLVDGAPIQVSDADDERVNNLAMSPDGSMLAIPGVFSDDLTIIDTATFTIKETLFGLLEPTEAAFSPDNRFLAVANRLDNSVEVFDVTGPNAVFTNELIISGGSDAIPDDCCNQQATDDPTQVEWLDNNTLLVLNSGAEIDGTTNDANGVRQRAYSVTKIDVTNHPAVDVDCTDGCDLTEIPIIISDSDAQPERANEMVVDPVNGNFLVSFGSRSISTGGGRPVNINNQGFIRSYSATTGALLQEFAGSDSYIQYGTRSADNSRIVFVAPHGEDLNSFTIVQDASPCPGDANGDLIVNVDDFIAVLLNFGSDGSNGGDANSDSVVNVQDFIDVLLNFGTNCD
ncbi:MAG: hypothetical protein AAGB34_03600 [Planctomycetota bacterium]